MRLAPGIATVTCLSSVASLNGDAEKSYQLLLDTVARNTDAAPAEKIWAMTLLGEIATRLGRIHEAEARFRQALALDPVDPYLLAATADFLLDQNRPDEVISLLRDKTRADALLLRLAVAEKRTGAGPLKSHVETLRARFENSRLRGSTVHRREEAMFELHLLEHPRKALDLALANWEVQKEPADARILLEAALASNQTAEAQPVLVFVEKNRLEDVRLAKLADQLNASNHLPNVK